MSLFGKKDKKVETCCCGAGSDSENTAQPGPAGTGGTTVKVLGSGCKKCNELDANAKAALTRLGMDASIEHVTDFAQIAGYGVMTTPALVVNGKVVLSGRVPKTDEIMSILQKHG